MTQGEEISGKLGTSAARFVVRSMRSDDFPQVSELWHRTGCHTQRGADDFAAITLFLGQNPDLSVVAAVGQCVVGAVLCGEDGRAGFIHRLAVSAEHDEDDVAQAMVRRSLLKLRALGLTRCYLLTETGSLAIDIGRSASLGLGKAVSTITDRARAAARAAVVARSDSGSNNGLEVNIARSQK